MKISMTPNKKYLFANESYKDVIVSLDLDTTLQNEQINNEEPTHYCFLLDISQATREEVVVNKYGEVSDDNSTITKKERIKLIFQNFMTDTIHKFDDNDIISLVIYDVYPQIVFQGCKKNQQKEMHQGMVNVLKYEMKSNYNKLSFVLNQCIKLMEFYKYQKNKMILITDTKPSFCRDEFGTVIDTEEDVLSAAKNVASKKISLDCICLGSMNDEEKGDYEFAEKIVQASNGVAYTIEDPNLIKLHLEDSVKGSKNSSRYNGRLILLFNNGVEINDCYSVAPINKYIGKIDIKEPTDNIGGRHCIIELPELKDDQNYNYLLELKVPTVLTNEEKQNPSWQGYKPFKTMVAYLDYKTIKNGKIETVKERIDLDLGITHDEFRATQDIKGNVDRNYTQATLKKYEKMFLDANKNKDLEALHRATMSMCEIYEEMGLYEGASMMKNLFNKFKSGIPLKPMEVNTVVKTSSTARATNVSCERPTSIFDVLRSR